MANSYVDGIKVKISEKYKPPCKISMPMSYSQRLSLNKQLQDNRLIYDFNMENSILERMKQLKIMRKTLVDERKDRIKLSKKKFYEKVQQEQLDQLEQEKSQANVSKEEVKTDEDFQACNTYYRKANNSDPIPEISEAYNITSRDTQSQHYVTKNGILMPIPVTNYSTNYSNILKPMPSSNTNVEPQKTIFKPFNLSDFESDTSSPFDNMELKSINDLEELAQVLKRERDSVQSNMYPNTNIFQNPSGYNNVIKGHSNILQDNTKTFSNFPQGVIQSRVYEQSHIVSQNSQVYNPHAVSSEDYTPMSTTYSQHNPIYNTAAMNFSQYNAVNNMSYNSSAISNYSNINGQFYNTPSMASQIQIGNQMTPYPSYSNAVNPSMQKSSCKSVPDLVKSVEKELENTHLNDVSILPGRIKDKIQKPLFTTTNVAIPSRPKSTDAVYSKNKFKEENIHPFDRLSKEQKEICRNVSVMGFPLDRVARVCLKIGNDQKKIVDHLLALSDLLDLGFPEKDASEALQNNDNDRDKALDVLIS